MDYDVDFAISYAGEDQAVARELDQRLRELGFTTFFAGDQRHQLAGVDGEDFFEQLFSEAKVVVAFISTAYRAKVWTRFEWDVILDRPESVRYVPVRLDKSVRLLGLPSSVMYLTLDDGWEPIVRACATVLVRYEELAGIDRPNTYQRILQAVQNESKGALAKAYQLAKDQRQRDPLEDIEVPAARSKPCAYTIVRRKWFNYSVVRRLETRITVPPDLQPDDLRWNLQHCCAVEFNAFKPDALSVLAYALSGGVPAVDGAFTAGHIELAPFGDWGKAEEGVAYNLPTAEFEYAIEFAPSYFA